MKRYHGKQKMSKEARDDFAREDSTGERDGAD